MNGNGLSTKIVVGLVIGFCVAIVTGAIAWARDQTVVTREILSRMQDLVTEDDLARIMAIHGDGVHRGAATVEEVQGVRDELGELRQLHMRNGQ